VLHLSAPHHLLLEPTCPGLPLVSLSALGLQGVPQVLAFELPLLEQLELLGELELLLTVETVLVVLLAEELVEA